MFEFLAGKLGLEKPSEGTMQLISVVLLAMSEGEERALEMTPKAKNEYLKAVKRWWTGFWSGRKRQVLDKDMLWVLPASAALLNPDLAHHAFDDEAPAPPQLSILQIERLRAGSWMRIHPGKSDKVQAQPVGGQLVSGAVLSPDPTQPMQMM